VQESDEELKAAAGFGLLQRTEPSIFELHAFAFEYLSTGFKIKNALVFGQGIFL
jgi:hypothetical protein